MRGCAETPRHGQGDTWITDDMFSAYCDLHDAGYAHSVEVWNGQQLVGGIYGVALGRIFFGESMFSHQSDASKAALAVLIAQMQQRGFVLLDCQVASGHLASLGSREIPRQQFLRLLAEHAQSDDCGSWDKTVSIEAVTMP